MTAYDRNGRERSARASAARRTREGLLDPEIRGGKCIGEMQGRIAR